MPDIDVDMVRSLIAEQLEPALAERCKAMEATMLANVTEFQERIQTEVRRDHAENRTRLNDNYEAATSAAVSSARAAAEATVARETVQEHAASTMARFDGLQCEVRILVGEVRGWAGRREGESAEQRRYADAVEAEVERKAKRRERIKSTITWLIGLGGPAGVLGKLVWNHMHHGR
jgi:hypothetical protein